MCSGGYDRLLYLWVLSKMVLCFFLIFRAWSILDFCINMGCLELWNTEHFDLWLCIFLLTIPTCDFCLFSFYPYLNCHVYFLLQCYKPIISL
uniref:Uncharacterized protein n=1 Tax=Pyxicephalus adspersus TaxID=30357 RepID=A0AAV2ZUN9_PYXAD|nr:TPA: hypothetical protein GDO54_015104 [Pyxicephalus adspersus]